MTPRKVRIVLTTITPLNTHHLQLGLHMIQSYFLEKMKERRENRFLFDIKVIYPKKRARHHDYFPVFTAGQIGDLAAGLLKKNPDVIGFSCFMWNIDVLLKIARVIKRQKPETLIVFGGPEVSYQAAELLRKHSFIDIVAVNDGEETFYELVRSIFLHEGSLEDIRGIVYRSEGKIMASPERTTRLEELPSPYFAGLVDTGKKDRSYMVETLRGCPFRCAYCSYHLGAYGRVRYFPIEKVKSELKLLLSRNVPHLVITDDNFNIHEERARELLDVIARYRKDTNMDAFMNLYVRKISPPLAEALSRADLFLSIGVQTINRNTLATINRRQDLSLLEENIAILNSHRLRFDLQFIIGLPGDTFADFKANLEWALKFRPYKISFFPLSVMHGTDIYRMAAAHKIKYEAKPPYLAVRTNTLTSRELTQANRIFESAHLLYNLGFLRQTVLYLREALGIGYFTIFDGWDRVMHEKKLQKKNIPSLATAFVTRLLAKQHIPITGHMDLFHLIQKDLASYYGKHLN